MDRPINYRDSYLDLLEKTLAFALWPEPLHPIATVANSSFKARLAKLADRILFKFTGVRIGAYPEYDRENAGIWPLLGHTMIGRTRLRNIRQLCERADAEHIPGAFVECGVWRGGACLFARACLDPERTVIACDSFDGLPFDPTEPCWSQYNRLKVPLSEVVQNFSNYSLNHNVQFLKGPFSETLPTLKQPIAILRCDGDMYSSTLQTLCPLYPQVSPGGFVIIDDWGLPSCRRAVEDYLRLEKLKATLIPIDATAVYWRKP